MKKYLFFLFAVFFVGCSTKINLQDFRPTFAPKNPYAPKDLQAHVTKFSLVKFPPYSYKNLDLSDAAFLELKSSLISSKFIKIIRIIDKKEIKDEIKAAELAQQTGNKTISADYILKGKLFNAEYLPIYHKGFYYYVKYKGKKVRKYSPPYYSYKACVTLAIDILSLPTLKDYYSESYYNCVYYTDNKSYQVFYPNLLIDSAKGAADQAYKKIKDLFPPVGYIYELRKNDDKTIAKISLGKNQGIKEGMKLNVYALQKDSLSGEIEKYPIGKAEVSNLVFDNSAWVVLDTDSKVELGDIVIPVYQSSFWDWF